MMKKQLYFLYFLTVLLGMSAFGQDDKPLKFTEFYKKEMKIIDGIVPVYYDGEHIYIEIRHELLRRSWLLTAQIDKGADLINRSLPASRVFYFEKGPGYSLCAKRKLASQRITGGDTSLVGVLANSGVAPIDKIYRVKAFSADNKGYIIDVTSDLKNVNGWFRVTSENLKGDNPKSTEIVGVNCFDKGVHFRIRRSGQRALSEGVVQASYAVSSGEVPVDISGVLRLLPEQAMNMRPVGNKAGYEIVEFTDYGNNPYRAMKDSVIVRWRLEISPGDMNAYKRGQLVKPLHPLVFYIDPACPPEYRKPIEEGILQWNGAFEQAGFLNALEVRVLSKQEAAAALPAVISFDLGTPGVKSEKVIEPVTGEILHCRMNIGHGFAADYLTRYLLQCGNADQRVMQDIESPEIVRNILRFLVAKEAGKMFGLTANYRASTVYVPSTLHNAREVSKNGFTTSVTDDVPFHYMACPDDGINPDDLIVKVGEYDKWAIEWGYRIFPGTPDLKKEREILDQLYRDRRDSSIGFCNAPNSGDVAVRMNNLSSDPLAGLGDAVVNLKSVYEKLEAVCYGANGVFDEGVLLKTIHRKGLALYMEYMQQAGDYIGACQNGIPLSGKKQHEAFVFLDKHLLEAEPAWLSTDFLRNNNLDLPVTWVPDNVKSVFARLFSPEVVNCLAANAWQKGKDCYTGENFWRDVHTYIFGGFKEEKPLTAYQIAMRKQCVEVLLDCAEKNNIREGDSDYAVELLSGLKMLCGEAERLAHRHKDPVTCEFYHCLYKKIEKYIR